MNRAMWATLSATPRYQALAAMQLSCNVRLGKNKNIKSMFKKKKEGAMQYNLAECIMTISKGGDYALDIQLPFEQGK